MNLIQTAPKGLNLIALLSIIVLILKILFLNNLPALFHGAEALGVIVEAVLASIIASYVFYLIVVHLKELSDKKVIYPLVLKWSNLVVGDCSSQLAAISKESGVYLKLDDITEKKVKDAFSKLHPFGEAPLLLGATDIYATWIQFLLWHRNRTNKYINKILSQIIYVESEIISKVVEIDDCSHFSQIEAVNGSGLIKNIDISFMGSLFYKYCLLCKELKVLIDNSMEEYG